ncbi:MAG TPA: M28 family peptidase [Candidatus Acidoferrum sp.]|nr:M28 family peptidase [Candidatus Acidoferrum sp.]
MLDFRIYRAGFLPALAAVVILLFALQGAPAPLPAVVAPTEFDQTAAAKIARQIVEVAPMRTPGSDGDAQIADLVERHFKAVTGGEVAEQRFTSDDRDLRNVILTLPGESSRSVVVLAARDSASGPGAASSAAATASLLALVDQLRTSQHTKTLVFVSTDGASDGAAGARQFAEEFPRRGLVDGAVVLWQPGSSVPRQPFLLDASDGPESASAQLVRTAERALTDQTGKKPQTEDLFGELAQLALPSALGEQGVLIEQGIDAVGLSSAGERPLAVAQDQPDDLSPATLGDIGRTALLLVATLDGAAAPPEHGPSAYLNLGGNLIPAWTLALLALCLLLPAALASLDGLRQAFRHRVRIGWALGWSASRAAPLFAALLLLYLFALVGIVARPAFPFDPNRFGVGVGQVIVMALLALAVLAGYRSIQGWRVPAALPAAATAPALGLVAVLAVLLAWLTNPYLALLLVPAAHVWLVTTRRSRPPPWPLVTAAAVVSLIPIGAAGADLAGRLALGSEGPWELILMVGDGQIPFGAMAAACLLTGSLVGIVALAARRAELDTFPIESRASHADLGEEG